MTPKEKADQLYRFYIDYTFGHYNCQQCCLLAVEELISETGSAYWYKVKQEIIRLQP